MLLEIKCYEHVWNDEVRQATKQLYLSAVVQSQHLSVLAHCMNAVRSRRPEDRETGQDQRDVSCNVVQDYTANRRTSPEQSDKSGQNRQLQKLLSTFDISHD